MKKNAVMPVLVFLIAVHAWAAEKPSPALPRNSAPASATAEAQHSQPPAVVAPKFATAARPLALPAGTTIRIKLESAISTGYNRAGDPFAGRVTEPVVFQGTTVIPVGASVAGHVIKVAEMRRYRGRPLIDLHPETITMPNGERYNISAVVSAVDSGAGASVNDEGEIHGSGMDRGDKMEMAAGTGAGLAVGAVAGGGKGAFIGAAVGVTATAVHWLSKSKSADLPAGSEIAIELGRPVMLNASGNGR